ncbi:MbtH family protein [Stappia indica]|uniref:MbtH family protein n=1 Tax=Stappia indica TaxID=538381 RepID=UPI001CD4800F|nr:MbtH family NRPS accessory protein [Stappia indica]MCA1299386.1 MbtH family NRPS accessory protein [Stappia indica]
MFDDVTQFKVVRNDSGQYSLWPANRVCPQGWSEEGTRGPRETCLAAIGKIWTDMRPAEVRGETVIAEA